MSVGQTIELFRNEVKFQLKQNRQWLPDNKITETAETARNLFLHKNYDREEAAAADALLARTDVVNPFEISVDFVNDAIVVDYHDGTDKEYYEGLTTVEDVIQVICSAVEAKLTDEENY
jgi:hypothetical protein